MRKLTVAFSIWIFLFSLATLAYADPKKDKNLGQEVAEKFVTLWMKQDFMGAAALGSDDKEIIIQDAKLLRQDFNKQSQQHQKFYSKNFKGVTLLSRKLAPQTLVTTRRGDDGKEFKVLAFFTEDHRVSVFFNSKKVIWHFFWHIEYMITVKDGKIALFDFKDVNILMLLNPKICVAPAICPK